MWHKLSAPSSGHCFIHLPFVSLVILTFIPSIVAFSQVVHYVTLFNSAKCATEGRLIGKFMFVLISLKNEEEFLLLSGCIKCIISLRVVISNQEIYNYCGCSPSLYKLLISVYIPSPILSHKTVGFDAETTLCTFSGRLLLKMLNIPICK